MAETYKRMYGWDWPKDMTDDNVRLTIGKKWREYRDEFGFEFRDPWVPMLDAARHLFGDYLKVSERTEQHFHDWVMEQMLITIGAASSGKLYERYLRLTPFSTTCSRNSSTRRL